MKGLPEFSVCSVFFNEDIYYLRGISEGTLGFVDPEIPPVFLEASVPHEKLGSAILDQLSRCRKLDLASFMKLVAEKVPEITANQQVEMAVQRFGYKDRKAFFKKMKNCRVGVDGDELEIVLRVRKGTSEDFKSTTADHRLRVPMMGDPTEIGKAIRALMS